MPRLPEGSLDYVELIMAFEEAFGERLTDAQGEQLMLEIEERMARGEFGDEGGFDDDDLAALVRNLGPRSPRGSAGAAAAQPEDF